MSDKNSKVAVISGGSKGLGKSLSWVFAENNYDIIAIYRSDHKTADAFSERFEAEFGKAPKLLSCDLGNSAPIISIPKDTTETVVIHNASAQFRPTPIHLVDIENLGDLLKTNISGAQHLLRATIKSLSATNGSWVSVLSSALEQNPKGFSHYMAAKAGLKMWTMAAEKELGKKGISFYTSMPDFMETPLTQNWPEIFKGQHNPQSTRDVAMEILKLIKSKSDS